MAPAGAYGRMIVDTTSAAQNLDVKFEPARYFFRTSTGMNVELKQIDDSTWMAEKAWHIIDDYMELQGTILLSTDSVFSLADKGAAISGWSVMVDAPITLIASLLGFDDQHAFSRSFKKHYGISPSACRNRIGS